MQDKAKLAFSPRWARSKSKIKYFVFTYEHEECLAVYAFQVVAHKNTSGLGSKSHGGERTPSIEDNTRPADQRALRPHEGIGCQRRTDMYAQTSRNESQDTLRLQVLHKRTEQKASGIFCIRTYSVKS